MYVVISGIDVLYEVAAKRLVSTLEVCVINIGEANIRYGIRYEIVSHLPDLSVIG
jgi:hypothetical protein